MPEGIPPKRMGLCGSYTYEQVAHDEENLFVQYLDFLSLVKEEQM